MFHRRREFHLEHSADSGLGRGLVAALELAHIVKLNQPQVGRRVVGGWCSRRLRKILCQETLQRQVPVRCLRVSNQPEQEQNGRLSFLQSSRSAIGGALYHSIARSVEGCYLCHGTRWQAEAHQRVRPLMVSNKSLGWKLSRSTPHPVSSCSSCATSRSLQGPSHSLFSRDD